MGNLELQLLFKFGVPLAVKLLAEGKDKPETVVAVNEAIRGIAAGGTDVVDTLLNADEGHTKSIIDGLFDVIAVVGSALSGLIGALVGLLGGK